MNITTKRFKTAYICTAVVAYLLPLFFILVIALVGTLPYGLLTVFAALPGAIIAGALIFFPYCCIYYAVLSFVHTIVDAIIFRKHSNKNRIFSMVLSFVCSAHLMLFSLLTVRFLEWSYSWIFAIFMIGGALAVSLFTVKRVLCIKDW